MNKPTLMLLSGFLLGSLVTLLLNRNNQDALQFVGTPSPYPVRVAQQTAHGSVPGQNADATQSRRRDASTAAATAQPLSFALGSSGQTVQFSAEFVSLIKQLLAVGEPTNMVVNLVVAEFNRQWRDQANAINRKLRSGELDYEESQEFFYSRNDALGKTITELLGEASFIHWDKQRLLQKASGYALTAAESNELYGIEKEYLRRTAELTRARDDGELDPLDYNEQRRRADDEYQQNRAGLLTESRKEVEGDNVLAGLKAQTRDLNLTPQQLTELVNVTRNNIQAEQELESQPKDSSYADKRRELEATAEREWTRILGPQGYANFKKASDYRYQTMKRYQNTWRLSDADLNYIYQSFAKYDRAIEEHNAQTSRVTEDTGADGKINSGVQTDNIAGDTRQQLESELLQFLGADRFLRLKTAGLIPDVMPQDE